MKINQPEPSHKPDLNPLNNDRISAIKVEITVSYIYILYIFLNEQMDNNKTIIF